MIVHFLYNSTKTSCLDNTKIQTNFSIPIPLNKSQLAIQLFFISLSLSLSMRTLESVTGWEKKVKLNLISLFESAY